ncbi:glycine cleavage system aminomethyltransferase GcvT [Brachybacterium endophyticum]|uniref:Aminomethyltransferase n=1 Tax=Brachybacterium endophyticum TaxID=2182385 RepID=A0A2U2RLZ2_9MICO|nr:glycine cleavage system aminomethyltransferase GcvT [Brachybacterium endophyticum]PWH06893.1 glycine cleavage system aminomethyltransferase GcvT [Brachybacterium endophyticum]
MPDATSRTTPLQPVHEEQGATFTDFAGWQMPVRYTSDLAEHRAVREHAGIFDLSHMGEIELVGPQAGEALDHALAGKLSGISEGRAKYSLMLTEDGGIIDDLIVYRLGEERFLVVANASNAEVVAQELCTRSEGLDVRVQDRSTEVALIAVQGPSSADIVTRAMVAGRTGITLQEIAELKYYRVITGSFEDDELLVARTGYTGEDGFELYVPAERALSLWAVLTEAGGAELTCCGLASRDTLRLEAGMPLYGHELSRSTYPAQAGMGRVVALTSKGDFVGREAVEAADAGALPVLVGLAAEGRRAGRAGAAIRDQDGQEIGEVTSGVLSPTLGHPIALAYLDPAASAEGTEVVIDVRGKDLPATVVPLPFYRRS